ncbi:MAG: arginine--tRNA ligase [Candidatus Berkelbacteria bacterium]
MKKFVTEKLSAIAEELGFGSANFNVEVPPRSSMGDFATNLAMVISGNPRENAAKVIELLVKLPEIEKAEIAGPGFINITLKSEIILSELAKILEQKELYGRTSVGKGKTVNVEYISANPTGPLHVGNARSGPIGAAIANVYEFLGYDVTREYYVNDVGIQIGKFERSLAYWYLVKANPALEFPEGGYPAAYIKETSEEVQKNYADKLAIIANNESEMLKLFREEGLRLMIEKIKQDAKLLGIVFDKFSYESEFSETGRSKEAIEKLKQLGFTAEKDGAIWFKRPDDANLEDLESVLVKSDAGKTLTYFANDISYHLDKIGRGFDKIIDVWGANSSGHIPRMKAAMKALGYSEDILEIVLYQFIRLTKAGKSFSMGKRLGNFVTLKEVIEAGVQPDAYKYFILSQNLNTPFDFDIDLAADRSEKNPVFYIKYAHARICSILAKTGEDAAGADLSLLTNEKEVSLMKEIIKFPEIVSEVAIDFQVQSLPHYAYKIAKLFHDFYGSCRIVDEAVEIRTARLALILATKSVLKNVLNLCSIEAPDKM